jgi:hypothetical protein
MNLPLINNDNAGNSYYGWTTNNLDWAPGSLGFTTAQCANWINGFFGQTCAFADSDKFNLILPVSFESLSLPATASKFRFNRLGINKDMGNPSTTTMDSQYCGINCIDLFTYYFNRPSSYYWAVLNSHSLSVFVENTEYSVSSTQRYIFFSCGWLKDPLFTASAFVQNAYFLWTFLPGLAAGRPSLALREDSRQNFVFPGEATTPDPIANYSVSCQTATPGANTTEFYLRDNVAPNKAVGYISNVLKSSLDLSVGGTYRNTGVDPDGSNNPYWKCVAKIGNESILMREWATGIV